MKSKLDQHGQISNFTLRGTNLTLGLKLTRETGELAGAIASPVPTELPGILMAYRPGFNAKHQVPSDAAGAYTMVLPRDAAEPNLPRGNGYGAVKVASTGTVSFAGKLGDGRAVSQATPLWSDLTWPLYLGAPGETVVGRLALTPRNGLRPLPIGALDWLRDPASKQSGFDLAFPIQLEVLSAPYTPGVSLSGFESGLLDSDALQGEARSVSLSSSKAAASMQPLGVNLQIAKPTGIFSGKLTVPGVSKAVPFTGVVLQERGDGFGLSVGPGNEIGAIEISKAP